MQTVKRPVQRSATKNRPAAYRGNGTGLKTCFDEFIGRNVRIIVLDADQRLPYSFAISDSRCGYREFKTISAARKFARSL
jgi:hypothetical protein